MSDDEHDDENELDRREFLADSLIVSAAAASWWGFTLKTDAMEQTGKTVPVIGPIPDNAAHYNYSV